VIVEAAENLGADLVVAGTRGQTGWKRVFLGSTAAEIVRRAHCPVLTVHTEHVRSDQPIRHVLVPTDHSEDAMQALQAAVRILAPAAAGARVTLLHAFQLQAGAVYPWAASTLAYGANELARESVERLEQIAEPIRRLGFDVQTTAREGYPPQVIDEEASRLRADLIAMGTHGRSGLKRLVLGSVAERILPNAPCPVVTVHTEETR
jgi:nucleotide-binding universal stress UspA family protein